MNFGYLLIVTHNDDVDYLKMAYAVAISIKNTQKQGYDKIALIIDDQRKVEKLKSPWVFDKVIEWSDVAGWDARSYMDQLTPWEHTVCIDVDMLFFRDHSHWIDYFVENCELYIANQAYTISGDKISSDYYRKAFTENDLPNLYSMWTFFKKDTYKDFFDLNREIIRYPTEFKNIFLSKKIPRVVGTDEAFALAAKILDISDDISYDLEFLKIVHMKPMVQNWPWETDRVTDQAGFYLNPNGRLKIGNFQQYDPVHYVEKDLITDEVISILEELIWKKP
jgi:hypothetical protein